MRRRFLITVMPFLFLCIQANCQIVMTNQGELFIEDDQLVHVDGHFANQSTFFTNRGDFSLTGNFWNEAKVSNPGYGILRFVGTNQNQTFFVYDSIDVFNLEIDNPDGLTMSGTNSVRIFSEMDFTDGIVYTNSMSMLEFQPGSEYFNASDFSHINGPAIKRGIEDFVFPIGKGGLLRPSGIKDLTESTSFRSEYFNYPHVTLNTDNTLYRVSNEEHWEVDRLGGSANASVLLTYEDGIGGFTDISDVRMAYFDSPWTRVDASYGGSTPAIFESNNLLSKFGLFTFAENELPQPAITFEVFQNEDCAVELNWVIPPGARALSFEVELSFDSLTYTKIGELDGDSLYNTFKVYQFFDYELHEADRLYYRIKIIQPGGSFYYTTVYGFDNKCIFKHCSIFPNPVQSNNNLNMRISSEFEQTLTVKIFDVPGRLITQQRLDIQPGKNEFEIFTKKMNLPSGMYFLQVSPKKSLKFIVIYD